MIARIFIAIVLVPAALYAQEPASHPVQKVPVVVKAAERLSQKRVDPQGVTLQRLHDDLVRAFKKEFSISY